MFRLVILDFDGVILESVSVKTEAFRTLFSAEPEYVDEIVAFHLINGGMSRFDKFRYIYDHILRRELDPAVFALLSEKFSALVLQGVTEAPFVPGAREFLDDWHSRVPLYVVSATPEQELRDIIQIRGLARYFQEVFGSPRKKSECIREILKKSDISSSDILFVGDARNDLAAARDTGISFIGRVANGEKNIFAECTGVKGIIPDLRGLSEILRENV
jgi:phosphoglycolate phosphatase-like HAD superfamily hydrolase